jgi:lipoprotein NlpI
MNENPNLLSKIVLRIAIIIIVALISSAVRYYSHGALSENIVTSIKSKQYDKAIDSLNEALKREPNNPKLILMRGMSYEAAQKYDLAIKDLDQYININPTNPEAFAARGSAYVGENKYDLALQDFDKATSFLSLNEQKIDLLRGNVKFYMGNFAGAADDFKAAANKDPTDLDTNSYATIWLHNSRAHLGQDDKDEFEHNSSLLLPDKWPAPIIELYKGHLTAQEVLAKAMTGDTETQCNQTCEANYYLGELYLQQKQIDFAKQAFQAAVDHCPDDFVEKRAAAAELKL